MSSGGFHLIMNLDFLIILSIILLPCQRTWKDGSFPTKSCGISAAAGAVFNKSP